MPDTERGSVARQLLPMRLFVVIRATSGNSIPLICDSEKKPSAAGLSPVADGIASISTILAIQQKSSDQRLTDVPELSITIMMTILFLEHALHRTILQWPTIFHKNIAILVSKE